MMTKRAYQLIAGVIYNSTITPADKEQLAHAMALQLSGTNDRFDRARFIRACLEGTK